MNTLLDPPELYRAVERAFCQIYAHIVYSQRTRKIVIDQIKNFKLRLKPLSLHEDY